MLLILMVVIALFCCPGCGGESMPPVGGVVTMDGEPLEGVMVMFSPKGAGSPAVAVTKADGSFAVQETTGDGIGALAGNYVVTFSKMEARWDGRSYEIDPETQERVQVIRGYQTLPNIYTNQSTTPFGASVDTNNYRFTFELKSNP